MTTKKDEPQAEQVAVEVTDGKTEKVTVTRQGVALSDPFGNEVWVQPESVPVWLERKYKLKK